VILPFLGIRYEYEVVRVVPLVSASFELQVSRFIFSDELTTRNRKQRTRNVRTSAPLPASRFDGGHTPLQNCALVQQAPIGRLVRAA
jgi:hypothetical protein